MKAKIPKILKDVQIGKDLYHLLKGQEGLVIGEDEYYDGEIEPAVVKPKDSQVILSTFPISKRYKISHSLLNGLDSTRSLLIDKEVKDPTYNVVTNNCSDDTGRFIGDCFNTDFIRGITTPAGLKKKVQNYLYENDIPFIDYYQDYGDGLYSEDIQMKVPWYDYRRAADNRNQEEYEREMKEIDSFKVSDRVKESMKSKRREYYNTELPKLQWYLDENGNTVRRENKYQKGGTLKPGDSITVNNNPNLGAGQLPKVGNEWTEVKYNNGNVAAYTSSSGQSDFHDQWNEERLATGNFDDQLGYDESRGERYIDIQKRNRDTTPVILNPNKRAIRSQEDSGVRHDTMGYYQRATRKKVIDSDGHSYWAPDKEKKVVLGNSAVDPFSTLAIHELSHASLATPQESKISEIMQNNNKYNDPYLDSPTEIYSRLMEVRKAYGIDPKTKFGEDEIKALRSKARDTDGHREGDDRTTSRYNNFIGRYDDDTLMRLLNDVASTNKSNYNDNLA